MRSISGAGKEFKDWWNKCNPKNKNMQEYARTYGGMVCLASEWKNNTGNCRMSLTKTSGDLYIADVKFCKNTAAAN